MRKLFIFFGMIWSAAACAQNKSWLTHVKDTSFNTARDYRQNIKNYPFIKIVPDSPITAVKEFRNLVYCEMPGPALHIDAFIPVKRKSPRTGLPAVLIVHGGGWRSGDRSQHIPLAQHLAALGYPSFTVEYRLSTEALYPAAVNDLKAAVRWLRANTGRFNIDATKIAALGFSAGGELAAFMGTTSGIAKFEGEKCNASQSSSVQAVIDIDGTLSFVHPDAWETQHKETVGASSYWIGYPRSENVQLWEDASPLTWAANNKGPFLFLNSSIERMHVGRDDFKKMMEKKGVYVEVKEFENTPHSFCLYRPWFNPMVSAIDAFLKKVFNQ